MEHTVEEILEILNDLINDSFSLPGGKSVVDREKVLNLIDEVRENLPNDIRQAKNIVSQKNDILSASKREAEIIVKKAEDRARTLVSESEIVIAARTKANEMLSSADTRAKDLLSSAEAEAKEKLSNAETKTREIQKAISDFVNDRLERTEKTVADTLSEIQKTKNQFKGVR